MTTEGTEHYNIIKRLDAFLAFAQAVGEVKSYSNDNK